LGSTTWQCAIFQDLAANDFSDICDEFRIARSQIAADDPAR